MKVMLASDDETCEIRAPVKVDVPAWKVPVPVAFAKVRFPALTSPVKVDVPETVSEEMVEVVSIACPELLMRVVVAISKPPVTMLMSILASVAFPDDEENRMLFTMYLKFWMSVPVALGAIALESNVPATALYTSESEFIVEAGVAEGVKLPACAKENVAMRERKTTKSDLVNILLTSPLNRSFLGFL